MSNVTLCCGPCLSSVSIFPQSVSLLHDSGNVLVFKTGSSKMSTTSINDDHYVINLLYININFMLINNNHREVFVV
jgi:hypothetical protein